MPNRKRPLTFEQFRRKVVVQQSVWNPLKLTKYWGGERCPGCSHDVDQHGVPVDPGCNWCSCDLTWAEAGLDSLGLPRNYQFRSTLKEEAYATTER